MAHPLRALNENFVYNSTLARALLQLYPPAERCRGRAWLRRLACVPNSSPDELTKRNHYAWFLLLVLQRGGIHLTPPFSCPPPEGPQLPPLQRILPSHEYEEVLNASNVASAWVDDVVSDGGKDGSPWSPPPNPPPHLFLEMQPVPRQGVCCYMAAFSDPNF